MGVRGLTGLITRYAPEAIRVLNASALAKQTIAFDASCHLNKFIYGDEPHEHKHIYGFYQLARFCDFNQIKPVFVFDGPNRLKAKQLELVKRARTRTKVKYSLAFEKEQSIRLDHWLQIPLADVNSRRDKSIIASTFNDLGQTMAEAESSLSSEGVRAGTAETTVKDDEMLQKLMLFARELRAAVNNAEDTDKYTRTVRALVNHERQLIIDMVDQNYKDTKLALQKLRRDNQIMLDSLEKRSIRVTQAIRQECQEFLTALGYCCFTCDNHEAEAMCAHLGRAGITTATVSEDLDTLVFGEVPILRYFFARHRPILSIDPVVARRELGLSKKAFIDLCILCGTDFSGTIQGIGPHRAFQAIKQYGSIENLLKHLDHKRFIPHETFDYRLARKVFRSLPAIPQDLAAYEPPKVDESRKIDLLKRYDIDALTLDLKLKAATLQQDLIDSRSNELKDPFASNASELLLNTPF